MADDESRGVHLSDKQLVFVFMAASVAAVVVFLFGVLVGRGVQGAREPIGAVEMAAAAGEIVPDGAAGEAPAAADLSYPARLGKNPPAEQLKPAPSPGDDALRAIAPPEVPEDPLPLPPAPAPAPAAPATSAATYTVQVAAVRSRSEADGIVKQLKTKGYDAYVFAPDGGDRPDVFRVRIGSYKQKRQADLLAERLLREEKRYKPWVTR